MISKYNPIKNGDLSKDETIYPIKKRSDRQILKEYWLNNTWRTGVRNWTLFRIGIVTGLRASDLVRLKWNQLYNKSDIPRSHISGFKDKKTGKNNYYLNIKPLYQDLVNYREYRKRNNVINEYMFPSFVYKKQPIKAHTIYQFMSKAADDLGWEHVGSHSIRKTFGYIAYKQTHDLGYVMKRLNHTNPTDTLRYIGLEQETMDKITESIDWS